jgi:hypothetical protein
MQINNQNRTQKEPLLPERTQMFIVFFVTWAFLCAWSLSAFWQHINSFKPEYQTAAKAGACAGEFVLLALIYWKSYSIHLNVRKMSLIFGTVLGLLIIAHTGALRGLDEATVKQAAREDTALDKLGKMSKDQMAGANGRFKSRTQGEIAANAQKLAAETIKNRDETIKSNSYLPRWYLDGAMYSVIFGASLLCLLVVGFMMLNKSDIDRNYNGTPDHLEQPREQQKPQATQNEFTEIDAPGIERFERSDIKPGKIPPPHPTLRERIAGMWRHKSQS